MFITLHVGARSAPKSSTTTPSHWTSASCRLVALARIRATTQPPRQANVAEPSTSKSSEVSNFTTCRRGLEQLRLHSTWTTLANTRFIPSPLLRARVKHLFHLYVLFVASLPFISKHSRRSGDIFHIQDSTITGLGTVGIHSPFRASSISPYSKNPNHPGYLTAHTPAAVYQRRPLTGTGGMSCNPLTFVPTLPAQEGGGMSSSPCISVLFTVVAAPHAASMHSSEDRFDFHRSFGTLLAASVVSPL